MTKKIPLYGKYGEGKCVLVDDDDYEELSKFKWIVGTHGYAQRGFYKNGKTKIILMHRFIMKANKGDLIDHINRNKLDNRKENLRIANQAQNMRNCDLRVTNNSGYKGVHWSKLHKKWKAEITKDYKNYFIGLFESPEDAARAYDAKSVELFGEFARLNFPDKPLIVLKDKVIRSDNTSGYRGVTWDKRRNKWAVRVVKEGKNFYSGYFSDKHDAAKKYNEKALEAFGESAKINIIKREEVLS